MAATCPPCPDRWSESAVPGLDRDRARDTAEAAMMISDPAFVVLEETRVGLLARIAGLFRLRRRAVARAQYAASADAGAGTVEIDVASIAADSPAAVPDASLATRPSGSVPGVSAGDDLTAGERRARAIALRGFSQARDHQFDDARVSFAEAAALDPGLDLAKLPDFWRLPLGAQQAAIEAYEHVGRPRDAAELTAAARTMFRPRPVRLRAAAQGSLPDS
jgi:hypothetical protein